MGGSAGRGWVGMWSLKWVGWSGHQQAVVGQWHSLTYISSANQFGNMRRLRSSFANCFCGWLGFGCKEGWMDKTIKHSHTHTALKIRLYCFIYICHHILALLPHIWAHSYHDYVQYSAELSISNQLHPGALSWHITQCRRYKIT